MKKQNKPEEAEENLTPEQLKQKLFPGTEEEFQLHFAAKLFLSTRFSNSLNTADELNKAAVFVTEKSPHIRSVRKLAGNEGYAVLVSVHRKDCAAAYHRGAVEIARISDMFSVIRESAPQPWITLNFSLARAQSDILSEPRLVGLIEETLKIVSVLRNRFQ